jgi:hypothetical protein
MIKSILLTIGAVIGGFGSTLWPCAFFTHLVNREPNWAYRALKGEKTT